MYIVLTFDSLFIVYMLTYVLTKSNTALVVIKVITKLPNSEQSYKGKSPNCENRNDPDLVQAINGDGVKLH